MLLIKNAVVLRHVPEEGEKAPLYQSICKQLMNLNIFRTQCMLYLRFRSNFNFYVILVNDYFHRNQNMRKLSFLLSVSPTFSPKLFNNFWTRGNWNVRLKTLVNAERLVNGSVDARSHYEDRRQTLENNFHGSWMTNFITPRRQTPHLFLFLWEYHAKMRICPAFPHSNLQKWLRE